MGNWVAKDGCFHDYGHMALVAEPCAWDEGVTMPRGPQGQKRPADVIGAAVLVAKIATGDVTEKLQQATGKTRSGLAGAKARAENLSKEARSEIAKKAANARWR